MGIKIDGDKILLKFVAADAITKGQVVYVSGDGQVSPADDANAAKAVGVADNDASAGEDVFVIVYGKASVVADGAISAGDRVRAASTAGRVVSENTRQNSLSTTTGNATHAACGATDAAYPSATSLGSFLTGASLTNEETGRCIGIALASASAAGDSITILVTKL